ncbi:MAG: RNA polymerase sigma factor [Archangium sp.]|nr:RNA polymerase sigma factor [Archangium sp.]
MGSASFPAVEQLARSQPEDLDFAALYRLTFPSVWRVLARLGVAPDELPDAAQNVYLVAHRRRAEFAGRSSPRTWVVGIAVRVASDMRRTSARKPSQPLDEQLPDPARTPLELASQAEALALVSRLLETMPPERREIFLLAEFEEFTAPEIAEALSLNVNTVYSRLRLARRDFQAALQEYEAARGDRE